MLAIERRRKIAQIVNSQGSALVADLALTMKVTEETIRRDLEKLEAGGKVLRSHGGALRQDAEDPTTHFTEREAQNVAEKLAIAREALRRVREGDSIMLDASSTVLQMAKLLPDMPLTVVTNSIRAALELASRRSIRVISTGGSLLERSLSFAGPLAERAVSEIHVQKLFVSCKGLDREGGFSESNELLARLKTRMLEVSDVSYALLDHTKLGGKSLAAFAAPKDFKEIITDAGSPAAFFAKFRKSGLKLTRV